jgi:hypothetical protein
MLPDPNGAMGIYSPVIVGLCNYNMVGFFGYAWTFTMQSNFVAVCKTINRPVNMKPYYLSLTFAVVVHCVGWIVPIGASFSSWPGRWYAVHSVTWGLVSLIYPFLAIACCLMVRNALHGVLNNATASSTLTVRVINAAPASPASGGTAIGSDAKPLLGAVSTPTAATSTSTSATLPYDRELFNAALRRLYKLTLFVVILLWASGINSMIAVGPRLGRDARTYQLAINPQHYSVNIVYVLLTVYIYVVIWCDPLLLLPSRPPEQSSLT